MTAFLSMSSPCGSDLRAETVQSLFPRPLREREEFQYENEVRILEIRVRGQSLLQYKKPLTLALSRMGRGDYNTKQSWGNSP